MTKSQLMQTLADANEMSKKDVMALWDTLTELVYKEVMGTGEITLPGLGKPGHTCRPHDLPGPEWYLRMR